MIGALESRVSAYTDVYVADPDDDDDYMDFFTIRISDHPANRGADINFYYDRDSETVDESVAKIAQVIRDEIESMR